MVCFDKPITDNRLRTDTYFSVAVRVSQVLENGCSQRRNETNISRWLSVRLFDRWEELVLAAIKHSKLEVVSLERQTREGIDACKVLGFLCVDHSAIERGWEGGREKKG